MSQSFIGQVLLVAFSFPPRGCTSCAGQLLAISQNQALFALLGSSYGGDGRTSFGVPDLVSRVPVGYGNSNSGLQPTELGARGGHPFSQLGLSHLPVHDHRATTSGLALSGKATAVTTIVANTGATEPKVSPEGRVLTVGTTSGANPVGLKPFADPTDGTQVAMAPEAAKTAIDLSGVGVGGTVTVEYAGQGQSFYTQSPFQGLNYVICMEGVFPSRD